MPSGAQLRRKRCSKCRSKIDHDSDDTRYAPIYVYCNFECQYEHAIDIRDRQVANKKKRVEQGLPEKKKRESIPLKDKGLSHHWSITKQVMQKYAKLRDIYYNRPCISCGNHHLKSYVTRGSMPTGGHYKTGGAHKNLQFNLWNIHMEHLYCNSFDPEHLEGMRKNLIERIGQERLEWLESNPDYNSDWSDKDYLSRMRKIFNKRMKRYE